MPDAIGNNGFLFAVTVSSRESTCSQTAEEFILCVKGHSLTCIHVPSKRLRDPNGTVCGLCVPVSACV